MSCAAPTGACHGRERGKRSRLCHAGCAGACSFWCTRPNASAMTQHLTITPACRAAYNVSEGEQGLLVRQVYPLGSCAGQVQEGDVLTR